MKFQCDAVINAGKINGIVYIYDEEGTLVHTVEAPLAEIKQRARAIVDWLNSLPPALQEKAFCPDCGVPITSVKWHEEGTSELNYKTGEFEESGAGGYGRWECGNCAENLDIDDLYMLGLFSPVHDVDTMGRFEKIYMPSKEEAESSCGRKLGNGEYADFLHYCRKGMEGQLDWDIIKSCAAQEVMK